MQCQITHTLKNVAQSHLGGIGSAAKYLREIRATAMGEDDLQGHFSGWQILGHELTEDGFGADHMVSLFDSMADTRKLCKVVYGCSAQELLDHANSDEKGAYSVQMAACLEKMNVQTLPSVISAMDILLITDFSLDGEEITSAFSRQMAQGLRHYFKDVEFVIIAPNKIEFSKASFESNEAARVLHAAAWGDFGFAQIGSSGYMLCPASRLYIPIV
jgi:hypothetical protein